jgi:hypothetical protein
MASIGLIVKAEADLAQLPRDWVPEPLGSRADVMAAISLCVPQGASLALDLLVEEPHESEDPRCITVSGVWGQKESSALGHLCQTLGARFYDAELAEFIRL